MGSIATVSSAPVVGGGRTSVQMQVQTPQPGGQIADAQLNAALQRLSMLLYIRAHCDVPPSVTDFGGGFFNVLV